MYRVEIFCVFCRALRYGFEAVAEIKFCRSSSVMNDLWWGFNCGFCCLLASIERIITAHNYYDVSSRAVCQPTSPDQVQTQQGDVAQVVERALVAGAPGLSAQLMSRRLV